MISREYYIAYANGMNSLHKESNPKTFLEGLTKSR